MHIRRHAGQCRHGFSLASRGDKNRLLRRVVPELVYLDQRLVRHVQISQFPGNLNDIYHAAPFYHHLAVVLAG